MNLRPRRSLPNFLQQRSVIVQPAESQFVHKVFVQEPLNAYRAVDLFSSGRDQSENSVEQKEQTHRRSTGDK